jgi:ATP-dependent RNA helicase DDX3X
VCLPASPLRSIGRTGRAGKKGLATAFFAEKDTGIAAKLVEILTETNQEVPAWLQNMAQVGAQRVARCMRARCRERGGDAVQQQSPVCTNCL